MQTLDAHRAAALSSLLAIGCRSGDTVVGLSKLRRCERLAYVFVDSSLAERTLREMAAWEERGARVFLVDEHVHLTEAFGRQDARVVGVHAGSLADGIAGRLA
ncbi:MAG: hypothetical protein VXY00_04625 [Candidatus Latescibacterota bacterium]|nr:hypothetical protein [Candidatus Latescibacterota bacterium]MEE2726262.1 hypothetical protein [Candidatus Latescibacterota bacterium]